MRHGPAHTVTVVSLSILLGGQSALLHAQATFNMDLLEKNDHLPAVDLQRFNQQAGQPPGAYPVSWQVNGVTLDARKTVTFRQNDRGQLTPCLKPEDLLQAGVNPAVLSQATGATSRSCPELNALLPGNNLVAGRYHSDDASQRPLMMQLSLMRGFAHNLTLFGGLQSAAQYHNLSLGAGQGLGGAGALSLQLLNARDRHQQDPIDGRAWQLQYSKGFDRLGTQLTFTGWRYSHQRYATLSEAFSSPGSDDDLQDSDNKKATLQITASQSLPYDITLYLSLDQDSYWSGGATQRTANMGISSQVHGIAWSLSYSDSRSSHGDEEDDEPHSDKVVTLSLSVPLSHLLPGSYAGYTLTSSRHSVGSQMVSLNGTLLDNHALSYAVSQTRDRQNGSSGSLTAGYSSGRGDLNLGYSHDSQAARLNYGASGGILIHRHGVVFTPEMNGAVVLIDAGGAGGVTLANQKTIATNGDGYAVLPFATAYHRNDVSLDSHSLPENVDLANSTVTLVPTKDAVVLARFHTHVGYKALFTLQSRGQPLPFGSEVRAKDTNSIVASEGQVYLAGLAPKGTMYAQWGPGPQQRCSARYDLTPTLAQTPHPLILQQTLSCPF
ncbi:TPA: fimbria/pilus outer membrane usher protein [Klebsiella pneumoniae]|nr:fimbria/pilus outer membrane usher protein [Klebsiella pneumoniae]